MRRIFVLAMGITVGCSSTETTEPSSSEVAVESMSIDGPDTIRVPDSVKLTVSIRDLKNNAVTSRPVSFSSSAPEVATVSALGVVRALGEGSATITVSSESITARKVFRILPGLRGLPQGEECLGIKERYTLVLVNDHGLPVRSPWGVGEWDYDEDAGTWKLTYAEILLSANGCFSSMTIHRAASGRTITGTCSGQFTRASGSLDFFYSGHRWSAGVTANGLVEKWSDGTTLVYEQRPL